jgi:hypothetical protein
LATFPRFRPGVPVTVGRTEIAGNKCNPHWTAMPCWDLHAEGNCDAIQSAVDIVIDGNVSVKLLFTL